MSSVMDFFVFLVIAMCCTVQAIPSGKGYDDIKLVAVPDESGFSKLTYPHFDLQELGTMSKGELPAKEIKVIRTIKITVPHPFPVKVPHKVPYPVPVARPYPVHVTKLVPHPVPVPVEVVKSVAVPVEVPKPYPVPQQEYDANNGGGHGGGHGGSSEEQGHQNQQEWQPSADIHQQHHSEQQSYGIQGHADQSAGYAAIVAAHQQNYGDHNQQHTQPQQISQQEQQH